MKKRLAILFSVVLLIIIAGYIYVRYNLLSAEDYKPDKEKAESAVDLKPALIARLQQIVKDGSNGLYRLEIEDMGFNILNSTAWVKNAVIRSDSATEQRLLENRQLLDDVYNISLDSMNITGFGVEDLLDRKVINIQDIYVSNPTLFISHKLRDYNKSKRAKADSQTLYQRISSQLKSVKISSVLLENGTFLKHPPGKQKILRQLQGININLSDILIDSSTEYDQSRFLFAKDANIEMKNYELRTSDSLYKFQAEILQVNAASQTLNLKNVSFNPRQSKKVLHQNRSTRKEVFDFILPSVTFRDINWWSLLNEESLIAGSLHIPSGSVNIYLDKSLPKPIVPNGSFPQQLLMKLPFPVNLKTTSVDNLDLSYEEYNPLVKKSDIVRFANISANATGLTNMNDQVRKIKNMKVNASCQFLGTVPMKLFLVLNLDKKSAGAFNSTLEVGRLNAEQINSISENLGQVRVKKGTMNKATMKIRGTQVSTAIRAEVYYNDLHLTALKPLTRDDGSYKKKRLTNFIANAFIIKNNNPSPGEALRVPDVNMQRAATSGFFNYLWFSVLTGILETIGVSPSLIIKT